MSKKEDRAVPDMDAETVKKASPSHYDPQLRITIEI